MHIDTKDLFLYRHFKNQSLFDNLAWVLNNADSSSTSVPELREKFFEGVHELLEMAENYGFSGNLWHCYLTFELVYNENAFSKACEITGAVTGSIRDFAIADMDIFKQLYQYDFSKIGSLLGTEYTSSLLNYASSSGTATLARLNELSLLLGTALHAQEFYQIITDFYGQFGVGKFGLYKAFRIKSSPSGAEIIPVFNTENVLLEDLVGYEFQKEQLIKNTEAFVSGHRSNNVLLYGDSGTGKSSSIKAILNRYYPRGLRIIEIFKHQLMDLSAIITQIKDRNYKFILYMDDLSFEDYETEYKYLKAIIEGGLEKKPENVLIYATSNRRHLIREKWTDKDDQDDDLHRGETIQEKLSLAARFGLTILYGSPSRREYEHIVKVLAQKYGIVMSEEELTLEANRWEIRHGGLSGRTAQHFINYLAGKNI